MTGAVAADRRESTLADGAQLPLLGLGVWQMPNGRECVDAVRWALELGYRHIDTAQAYGNEESVGQGLRESGVPRDRCSSPPSSIPDARDPVAEARAQPRAARGRARRPVHRPLAEGRTDLGVAGNGASSGARVRTLDRRFQLRRRRTPAGARNGDASRRSSTRCSSVRTSTGRGSSTRVVRNGIVLEAYSPLGHGRHLGSETATRIAQRLGRTPAQVLLRWCIERDVPVIPKSSTPRPDRGERSDLRLHAVRRGHGGTRRARPHRRHPPCSRTQVVVRPARASLPGARPIVTVEDENHV